MAFYSQRCALLSTSALAPVCADIELDCSGGIDLEVVMRSVGILPASDNVTLDLQQQDPLPVIDDLLLDLCTWAESLENDNDASTVVVAAGAADLLISSAMTETQQTTSANLPQQQETASVHQLQTACPSALNQETALTSVSQQQTTFESDLKQHTTFSVIPQLQTTFSTVPKQQTTFTKVPMQEKTSSSLQKYETLARVRQQQTAFKFNRVSIMPMTSNSVPQTLTFNNILKQQTRDISVPKQELAFNRVQQQEMTFNHVQKTQTPVSSFPQQQATYYPTQMSNSHQSYSSQVPSLPDMSRPMLLFDPDMSAMSGPLLLFDQLESANMFSLDEPRVASPCYSDIGNSSGFSSAVPAMNFNVSSTTAVLPSTTESTKPGTKRPRDSSSVGQPTRKRTKKECSIPIQNTFQPTSVSPISSSSSSGGGQKPPMSYFEMIGRALMSSSSRSMVLGNVYEFILSHYPYFRTASASWRNAVRHNLTVNDTFVKAQRADRNRGYVWSVHPACVDMFSSGDFRRMQARHLAQQSYKERIVGDAGDLKKALPPASYQQMTYTTVSSAYSSMPSLPHYQGHSFYHLAAGM